MLNVRAVCGWAALLAVQNVCAANDAAFYETKVLPVLRANCFVCHSEKNASSGLSLETRESLMKGGNRGAAVKAGDSDHSLLLEAVRQAGTLKMPPGRKLSEEQITALETWVKDGAAMPAAMLKSKRGGGGYWAFQ